jgi:hypothetical protein
MIVKYAPFMPLIRALYFDHWINGRGGTWTRDRPLPPI